MAFGGLILSLYKAEAIVLRVRDFGEADKALTFLTREEGKVQAVAKGARRPRNRLAGVTQIFTHCSLLLFRGKNLDTLSQAEINDSFRRLREDLDKLAYATYFCELMDEMVKERDKNDDHFVLLLAALHLLNERPELATVRRWFELRLLSVLGYRPHLGTCVSCGAEIEGTTLRFSPGQGGLLCPQCLVGEDEIILISRGTLETVKRLMQMDPRRSGVLKFGPDTEAEMDRMLKAYISYRMEKRLKSLEFLEMVSGSPS